MGFWALVFDLENVELSSTLRPYWSWLGWAATPSELQGCFLMEPSGDALGSRFASEWDPRWAPNPEVFFRIGPPGWRYRGDLEGRPRQARGAEADVGRATLEDSSKLSSEGRPRQARGAQADAGRATSEESSKVSSAGQGGRQELPSQVSSGGCPLQSQAC